MRVMSLSLFCLLLLLVNHSTPQELNIAYLHDRHHPDVRQALQQAVHFVNQHPNMLRGFTLNVLEEEIGQSGLKTSSTHTASAVTAVCRQLQSGVVAVFGPINQLSGDGVQSICDAKNIPHFQFHWAGSDSLPFYSINLQPHPDALTEAFLRAIEAFHWKQLVFFYQNNFHLIRMQRLLAVCTERGLDVRVRRLSAANGNLSFIPQLQQVTGVSNMLVACDADVVDLFLKQALMINMMKKKFHYFFTSLDLSTLDLGLYSYGGANITGFSLLQQSPQALESLGPLGRDGGTQESAAPQPTMSTLASLVYDSVLLLATGLQKMIDFNRGAVRTVPLSCKEPGTWDENRGHYLFNFIITSKISGLTGNILFGDQANRSDFKMDLMSLNVSGTMSKIGTWSEGRNLTMLPAPKPVPNTSPVALRDGAIRVTTILEVPFTMYKTDLEGLDGNDRFEGYCIDLIKELSLLLGFNYTIQPVKDKNYGAVDDTGHWNGMVGELMRGEADLAVAPFTISYVREQVIDFTKPFMNLGISILFRKPQKEKPGLFAFLDPLGSDIWLSVIGAYLAVSFVFFVVGRFTPYEWDNPHPCDQDSEIVENQNCLNNSLWFTIGSFMQQGSDIAPKTSSTRIIASIWYFFTLIMISSYTANLAAFLTVERIGITIESAEDLVAQTEVKYGSQQGGSTMTFFKDSDIPVYQSMWAFMSSTSPSPFVSSSEEGIARVERGGYAYLMESVMIEYQTQRRCELEMIGGLLDSKGYGIGVPRDSALRERLSEGILKLQEDQKLLRMYDKWWKQERGGGACVAEEGGKVNALKLDNVAGVFLVLSVGCILALPVALLEWFWYSSHHRHTLVKGGLLSSLRADYAFAINCFGKSHKTRQPTPSSTAASSKEQLNKTQPVSNSYRADGSCEVSEAPFQSLLLS